MTERILERFPVKGSDAVQFRGEETSSRAVGVAKPMKNKSEEASNREKILVEATNLFREKGYEGTSMAAIARRVGMTPPGIYWYFPSKESILFSFLESTLSALHNSVKEAIGEGPASAKLRNFMYEHVAFHLKHLEESSAYGALFDSGQLLNSLEPEHQERISRILRRYREMCTDILVEGTRTGEFEVANNKVTAFAMLTMGEQVVSWYQRGKKLSPRKVAFLYADLAMRMVEAHPRR